MPALAGSLDANIVLRILARDIPERYEAAARLLAIPGAQYTIADAAIVEVAFVLGRHYRLTRPQIGDAIIGLFALPCVAANKALLAPAMELFMQRPALSFEDCCLAVNARLSGAEPLWTFDKKLANQLPEARLLAIDR